MSRRREHEQDMLRRVERLFEGVLRSLEEIACTQREILRYVKPHRLTHSIAVQFKGVIMADNALQLNVGQTSTATIVPLLADGTTNSGGTLSAVSFTFSDPSATVALNADGVTATVTAVAASSAGPVTGTASCTVTDTDGVTSQWTQSFSILVNGAPPPPQQLTQSIAVQFSAPTP